MQLELYTQGGEDSKWASLHGHVVAITCVIIVNVTVTLLFVVTPACLGGLLVA